MDGDWKKLEDEILNSLVFGLAGLATKLVTGSSGLGYARFQYSSVVTVGRQGVIW